MGADGVTVEWWTLGWQGGCSWGGGGGCWVPGVGGPCEREVGKWLIIGTLVALLYRFEKRNDRKGFLEKGPGE